MLREEWLYLYLIGKRGFKGWRYNLFGSMFINLISSQALGLWTGGGGVWRGRNIIHLPCFELGSQWSFYKHTHILCFYIIKDIHSNSLLAFWLQIARYSSFIHTLKSSILSNQRKGENLPYPPLIFLSIVYTYIHTYHYCEGVCVGGKHSHTKFRILGD